ncbi:MAG: tRNA (adenosine(37)-N6)-dimethylallyltransferase MiaA [Rhodospirillales bacterium]|nr:tRNA (adenosine(37)-N6)-dimethylallyltransferase MiaA [Rhodospirillales bacterium]
MEKKPVLIVAGPTASGKSSLALDVAIEFNGVVINADSMQVYDILSVITARPSKEDEAKAPHRLYGFLPPAKACSAGFWVEQAITEIKAAWVDGKLPILCGGTGLYLKTIVEGISELPTIPDKYREQATAELKRLGNEGFHQEVAKWDPEIAKRLPPSDSQRLIRAWEVFECTGEPLSVLQKKNKPTPPLPQAQFTQIVLAPPREDLYQSCGTRFDKMIEAGALEEVEAIAALNLDPVLPAMKALGVPEILGFLRGNTTLDQAREKSKQTTRNYAKRQSTWFRNQVKGAKVVSTQYSESIRPKIFSFIRQNVLTDR